MTIAVNMSGWSDDKRIQVICEVTLNQRKISGLIVETQEKAVTYVAKIRERYPTITIVDTGSKYELPKSKQIYWLIKIGPPAEGIS